MYENQTKNSGTRVNFSVTSCLVNRYVFQERTAPSWIVWPWTWRYYDLSKRRWLLSCRKGLTSFFSTRTVRTSNLAEQRLLWHKSAYTTQCVEGFRDNAMRKGWQCTRESARQAGLEAAPPCSHWLDHARKVIISSQQVTSGCRAKVAGEGSVITHLKHIHVLATYCSKEIYWPQDKESFLLILEMKTD